MRQWELFGITDSVTNWTPPPPKPATEPTRSEQSDDLAVVVDRFPSVLWTTDATLRFTSFPAVAELGLTSGAIDLLDMFGLDDEGEEIVSAHLEALGGRAATFELDRGNREIHCWVSPVRGEDGQVCGTICVGMELTADLRNASAEA